jgi:hypothetical protein
VQMQIVVCHTTRFAIDDPMVQVANQGFIHLACTERFCPARWRTRLLHCSVLSIVWWMSEWTSTVQPENAVYGPFSAVHHPHHDAVQDVVGYRILGNDPYFPDFDEEIFTVDSYDILSRLWYYQTFLFVFCVSNQDP